MATVSTNKVDALDALRIARRPEPKRRGRNPFAIALIALVIMFAVAGTGYVMNLVLTRPMLVETAVVRSNQPAGPGILLTGSGYVVTRHKYIIVGTKILGQIVEEPIEEGQRVKKGDLLARIDDRDYQAQLHQAVADRDLAESNLRLALSKSARERELYQSGVISKDDYETFENGAAVAQATLRRTEAAIEYAKFQVSQCMIISPIDGVVLRKYREVGDTINYGGQVQAGGGATDIVQLADTADMRAEVDINESDISKVSLGMPAVVVPDAYPQASFEATLVKIYPEADRQKATVKVEVQIRQPNLAIVRPEMSVKANFLDKRIVGENQHRLFVPPKSILQDGNETYVWAVRSGMATRVAIVRGGEIDGGVEVRQGLKNGDVVIVGPSPGLTEARRVRTSR